MLNTVLNYQRGNKTQAEPDRTKNTAEEKQCITLLNPTAKEFIHNNVLPTAKNSHIVESAKAYNTELYSQSNVPVIPLLSESALLQTYLDRQGKNEYVNLVSPIVYDGANLAFVFYENQIRRFVNESPYHEQRFEVLRTS